MKTFAAALFAASASAELMTSVDYAFMSFVSSFNKMYATAEEFAVRKEHYAAISEAIDAINSNPDIVLIQLGMNDSKKGNYDSNRFHSDYVKMIKEIKELPSNPQIFLIIPTPLYKDGESQMS